MLREKMLAFSSWLTYVLDMAKKKASGPIATVEQIERSIHVIRGQRVMLDSDLAELYGVTTKRLNEQVARNKNRFPTDFSYHLTQQEVANLKSQIATSSSGHHAFQRAQLAYRGASKYRNHAGVCSSSPVNGNAGRVG